MVKADLKQEIEIPQDIELTLDKRPAKFVVVAKKESKEITKEFDTTINMDKKDNKIILSYKNAKKPQKKKFGTMVGHINNMINGLNEDWEYELEICNVHFPMTVDYDKANKEIVIKNLLGEKSPRKMKVVDNVDIEIKAPKIHVKSFNKELAGQMAANLEKVSRVRNRDRNKFQDGIFITKKPGMEFL